MAFGLSRPRFGLLRYRDSYNLGDQIQSLAARPFLPRVDRWIERDALHRAPGWPGETSAILNGWYGLEPQHWPPHARLRPLLLSMHLSNEPGSIGFSAASAWVMGSRARYLRDHGPVGARDHATLALLQCNGIESYFSGCLTLTLARPDVPRGDMVVASDLDEASLTALRRRTRSPLSIVTHMADQPRASAPRFALAAALLDTYARARCVVTSRLHAALPCLAMGTPVLFVPPRPDGARLSGLIDLTHHDTPERFAAGGGDFDPDAPPANPTAHLPLAATLAERCRSFIAASSALP